MRGCRFKARGDDSARVLRHSRELVAPVVGSQIVLAKGFLKVFRVPRLKLSVGIPGSALASRATECAHVTSDIEESFLHVC